MSLHRGGRGSGSIRQLTTAKYITACLRQSLNRFSREPSISTLRSVRYRVTDARRIQSGKHGASSITGRC